MTTAIFDFETCDGFQGEFYTIVVCRRNPTTRERKRARRAHRQAAKHLLGMGTLFNPGKSPVGSTPWSVAMWHLQQARNG